MRGLRASPRDLANLNVRLQHQQHSIEMCDRLLKFADTGLLVVQLAVQLGAFAHQGMQRRRMVTAEGNDRTCHDTRLKKLRQAVSGLKVCLLPIAGEAIGKAKG